jgi:hypothetical protein
VELSADLFGVALDEGFGVLDLGYYQVLQHCLSCCPAVIAHYYLQCVPLSKGEVLSVGNLWPGVVLGSS